MTRYNSRSKAPPKRRQQQAQSYSIPESEKQRYIHYHLDAMKAATKWRAEGQVNWLRQWEFYAKELLGLATGNYRRSQPPTRPKCDSSNQIMTDKVRPLHLQGVRW